MSQADTIPIPWPNSLWAFNAPHFETNSALSDSIQADVTVVGAGFTGLRAALELAKSGSSVVVLDARDVGWGASGRNGGQVNPMMPFNSPQRLRKLVGDKFFERLTETSLNSADELFKLIRDNQIQCQARQNGWLRVLHSPKAKRSAFADVASWNNFGAGMQILEGDEVKHLSGSPVYTGAVLTPRGGAVQPMMLAQGLAAACKSHGVHIHGQSPVTTIRRLDGCWRVEAGHGSVTSGWVVIGTNGYTDHLIAGLDKTIIPLTPIQIATEPLAEEVVESILPGGQTISDSRRVIMYARKEPDNRPNNRIIYGGLGRTDRQGNLVGFDWLKKDAARVFPQLKGVRWTHQWGGNIAITDDHLPHLHEPQPGILIGLGYNGRGVAMSNVMGRVMAERVLGMAPEMLPFPTTAIRAVTHRQFKMIGLRSAIAFLRFLDWLETR